MAQTGCTFGSVATCLGSVSFAEGGEGTSLGGHYWLLCLESVFAISETARHFCVPLAIAKLL